MHTVPNCGRESRAGMTQTGSASTLNRFVSSSNQPLRKHEVAGYGTKEILADQL